MDSHANGMMRMAIASSEDGTVSPFETAHKYTIVKMERGEVISTEKRDCDLSEAYLLYEALDDCALAVASQMTDETYKQLVEHDITPVITDLKDVDEVVEAKLADRLKCTKKPLEGQE